jgi:hypothetical protein
MSPESKKIIIEALEYRMRMWKAEALERAKDIALVWGDPIPLETWQIPHVVEALQEALKIENVIIEINSV